MPIHEASTGAGLSGEEVQQEAVRIAQADLEAHPELERHADLVTDPDKALEMAHASKEDETIAAGARNWSKVETERAKSALLDPRLDEEQRTANSEKSLMMAIGDDRMADQAQKRADEKAEVAATEYDQRQKV